MVSPDGTRVALERYTNSRRNIWILDLKRLTQTQLTDGPTEDNLPLWSADGQRVFFASNRSGNFDVYSQAADGASSATLVFAAPGFQEKLPHSTAIRIAAPVKPRRGRDPQLRPSSIG